MYDDRMYVIAHMTREDQKKAINQAKEAGHFAMPIKTNCLELLLDGFELVFEYNEENNIDEKFSMVDVVTGQTRYSMMPRPVLTLTTMSPDYYNWCPLECMLNMKQLPLWMDLRQLMKYDEDKKHQTEMKE